MSFDVVIPARWESTRLPGKVLADLHGMPMIQRVYERAAQSDAGTDRIAEVFVSKRWKADRVVVSVQGDEPFIEPTTINTVANALLGGDIDASVSTAATKIASITEYLDPNVVKVVLDNVGNALYFSRASIPAVRDAEPSEAYASAMRHLGIYGYRVSFLRDWPNLLASKLENVEALEQLRILSGGYKIRVCCVEESNTIGVDTPEDLAVARELLANSL